MVEVEEHVVWAQGSRGLLLQRESGQRRHGLWRLPERSANDTENQPVVLESRYTITHHRVRLVVHGERASARAREGEKWIPLAELPGLPMPAPFRKVVDRLLRV